MNSLTLSVGFDMDRGGCKFFDYKVLPRLSKPIRDKINRSTCTKTPNGFHKLLEISRKDFPTDVDSKDIWSDPNDIHSELKFFGTAKYLAHFCCSNLYLLSLNGIND